MEANGLNFAIPPRTLKHEFDSFWAQLENLTPHNKELLITREATLSDIPHAYSGTPYCFVKTMQKRGYCYLQARCFKLSCSKESHFLFLNFQKQKLNTIKNFNSTYHIVA